MRTVHKWPVPFFSEAQGDIHKVQAVMLPVGARVVHVGIDPAKKGQPAVWIELDPDQKYDQEHRFLAVGTGRLVPDYWHHKGSAIHDGQLVWHVYGDRQ